MAAGAGLSEAAAGSSDAARPVVVVVIYQFLSRLIANRENDRLLKLGQQLSTYIYQLIMFFTFNSDERPYPFAAWPRGAPSVAKAKKSSVSNKEIKADK